MGTRNTKIPPNPPLQKGGNIVRLALNGLLSGASLDSWWDGHLARLMATGKMPVPPIKNLSLPVGQGLFTRGLLKNNTATAKDLCHATSSNSHHNAVILAFHCFFQRGFGQIHQHGHGGHLPGKTGHPETQLNLLS